MYLAIDPGGKRTGWAYFDGEGKLVSQGIVDTGEDFKDLAKMLRNMSPTTIVMEKFRLYPFKSQAQAWSALREVQVAGAVKMFAELNTTEIVEQPANILGIGFKFQGKTKPAHPADDMSARAHGIYYLVTNNVIKEMG
jgi:RNase H-fold protein (predicted Holliday junction resolvase)